MIKWIRPVTEWLCKQTVLTTKRRHRVRYPIIVSSVKSTELKYKFIKFLISYTIPPVGARANVSVTLELILQAWESVSTIILLIPISSAARTPSKQASSSAVQREKHRADENSFLQPAGLDDNSCIISYGKTPATFQRVFVISPIAVYFEPVLSLGLSQRFLPSLFSILGPAAVWVPPIAMNSSEFLPTTYAPANNAIARVITFIFFSSSRLRIYPTASLAVPTSALLVAPSYYLEVSLVSCLTHSLLGSHGKGPK